MVARNLIIATFAIALASGCGIKVNGGLDPTLHFHSSLEQLKKPGVRAQLAPAKRLSARIIIEPVAGYYPQPLGLVYSGGGVSRKLRRQYTLGGTPERRLTRTLRQVFQPGSGEAVLLTSALVALELYNLGGHLYSSAAFEARVVRKGHEVYTARYYARAKTVGRRGGLSAVWPALETQIVAQLQNDPKLYAALEGRR